MYVRLKHTLSALALQALRQPVRGARQGAVSWLTAFCDLASGKDGVRFELPMAAVASRARQARGLDVLLKTGLLERHDDILSLPRGFRPHFPYLTRQVHRLNAAVRAAARAPRLRGRGAVIEDGAALFNAGLFFECHELLEGAWRNAPAAERPFYHGVILVAAAFYHHEKGNLHGARIKLTEGMKHLQPLLPVSHGVRLDRWLTALGPWKDRLDAGQVSGVLRTSEIPRIRGS